MKRIHLFGIIALVLVLVSACSSDPDTSDIYGWSRIGETAFTPASASYLSLQVDAGTPYLAFRDSESNIHKASVMSWDAAASDWNFVGSQQFSSNLATNLSLQMYNGNPFVAYRNVENMTNNAGKLMGYNGISWDQMGPDFSDGLHDFQAAKSVFLQMAGSVPCVAYIEDGASDLVRVQTYNGSTWQNLPGTLVIEVTELALKAVSPSEIYLAYVREANNKIAVRVNDGAGWINLGESTGFSSGEAASISLDVHNGITYVAFRDEANGSEVTVLRWNGTAWTAVGAEGFTSGSGAVSSISLKASGPNSIYLCYTRGGNAVYVEKWNGSSWTILGDDRIDDANTFGSNPVMTLYNGQPFVAYETVIFENATPIAYGATVKKWSRQ